MLYILIWKPWYSATWSLKYLQGVWFLTTVAQPNQMKLDLFSIKWVLHLSEKNIFFLSWKIQSEFLRIQKIQWFVPFYPNVSQADLVHYFLYCLSVYKGGKLKCFLDWTNSVDQGRGNIINRSRNWESWQKLPKYTLFRKKTLVFSHKVNLFIETIFSYKTWKTSLLRLRRQLKA